MAPSVKKEVLQSVAALGSSVDGDFYMATFKGGKVQKVNNMMGGPPLRVRRVLDFDSKVEIEKEEALALKRRELGSGLDLEVQNGKKEKTLGEVLLEMKKRKSEGALATVQRKKVIPVKKAVPVKAVIPVEEVVPMEVVIPVQEVVPMEVVIPVQEVVPMEEVIPVQEVVPMEVVIAVQEVVPVEASPPRKKRKRRSTSLLHTCSKLLDPLIEHPVSQGDDETLAEFMKKNISTTGRASSDNAGIKVFQRRKVKFKAVRRRTSLTGTGAANPGSKSGDKQSSTILVCDDFCECEVCGPLGLVAPKTASPCRTVQSPTTRSMVSMAVSLVTSCLTSIVPDDHPEDGSLEGLSANQTEQLPHPDSCMGEFDTLTLPDDPPQLPVHHYNPPIDTDDIEELTEERFRGEVAQQVTALGSDFSSSASPASISCENSLLERDDKSFDDSNDGPELCDSNMPEVLDSESRPQPPEEASGIEGDVSQGPCAFNTEFSNFSTASPLNLKSLNGNSHPMAESSASVVTPMELELAEKRIESILETLVTPDDLLPTHLSASISCASKSTKKKKKRRSFSEPVTLDMVTNKEGSYLGALSVDNPRISQRQEEDLAEPISLDTLKSPTENVSSSVNDISEEVALSATTESSDMLGQQTSDKAEPISQRHGLAHEPILSLVSEEKDTPAACPIDAEVVLPSIQGDTLVNAEECSSNGSDSLVPTSDAVEVIGTPTKSTSRNDDSGICQTPSTGSDAAERDAGAGRTSTSKALFSNLKTDGLSKRNRKSFSPNSRLALIEAARSERSIPPFKIKLMKSNLSDRCSNKLFSQKMVKRKTSPRQDQNPIHDESSAQDMLQCDIDQVQLDSSTDSHPLSPPPQTTEDDSPNMSAPSPSGPPSDYDTHVVPGSPEYKKEPSVSHQSGTEPVVICTPVNSVSNLPCSEGSLLINVECHPGSPSDPKTPNEKLEPSQQLKSILKTRSDTCRGICECPRCVSTCELSATARNFIRSQMKMADLVARKLLDEMRNMRTLVEDASPSRAEATTSGDIPSEKAKRALESAAKMEDWATKEILKLSRDSKRVCRLIEVGPRRTIFADDAGRQLCHVKLLPAKKTLTKESLVSAKKL